MITLDKYIVKEEKRIKILTDEEITNKLRKYGINIKFDKDIEFEYKDLPEGDIEKPIYKLILHVDTPSSNREFSVPEDKISEFYYEISELFSKKNLSTIDLENFFEEYELKYKSWIC